MFLPKLDGRPIIVTNDDPNNHWHRRGRRWNNMGDGKVIPVINGDRRWWKLMMRVGTPPPGGACWLAHYDEGPLAGWHGNQPEPPIKALPSAAPYSHINRDTYHGFQNPYDARYHWFSGVKPGILKEWAKKTGNLNWQAAGGVVFCIQHAYADKLGVEPELYTQENNEVWLEPHIDATWEHPQYIRRNNTYWGGVAEGASFVDTFSFPYALGMGFYTAKTREKPDPFGETHRSRIGRYAFWLEGPNAFKPFRLPMPGPESYVWDPIRDGAGGEYGDTNKTALFGTANRILQMSVDPDPRHGCYRLSMWQSIPNTGQGKVNASVGFAEYLSFDQGLNWIPNPENPLFTTKSMGWEDIGIANRMNSSHQVIDPWSGDHWVFFWGNEQDRQNKNGTQLYAFKVT